MATVEVVKDEADQEQFDATKVDGLNPDFQYRWARCGIDGEDRTNIAKREMQGYEIVHRTTEGSQLSDRTRMKKGADVDDTVRWGDLILMRIPREKFEARLARERASIFRKTKGVAEAYKASIAKIAKAADNAFEEHRANPSMRVTESKEESMTQEQLDFAMKIASGIEEDVKEEG